MCASKMKLFNFKQPRDCLVLGNVGTILVQFLLLIISFHICAAYMVGDDPYHRIETLDSKGKYQLEWKVDWTRKWVTFNVSVATRGYVGFGLTSKGKMTGADIVIGGVEFNGEPYFSDRHAVGNQVPEEDPSQDWILHEARESDTHTFLSFSRPFDTCDPQDYPITEDKISLIWAYGERDNDLAYHHRNRGEYPVYLIHPDYSPPTVIHQNVRDNQFDGRKAVNNFYADENLQDFAIINKMTIPSDDTTYWCTMHKAPVLPHKHHVVGYELSFINEESRQRVHHLALHRCRAPAGRDANQMFSSYVQHRGQVCYFLGEPLGPIPTEYCTEFYSVWGVGGRPYFHPPEVGFPLGESPDEYYLLQVHYDNPDRLANMEVGHSIHYYYTSHLRPNEGTILDIRQGTPGLTPSLLIPPSSTDHLIYGFCGSDCTQEMFPQEGVTIYGATLHSHNTGAAIRLQQFRGNRELPWVISDDNYAFDYQQRLALNRKSRVLPGDLLAARCIFDNTAVNGTVVGGMSTRQEMCTVFIFYYNKILNYTVCSSQIESEEAMERFLGISNNVTWSTRDLEYIVNPPDEFAGLKVSEVSDNHVNWDVERREDLQRFHLREPQVSSCARELYSFPSGLVAQSETISGNELMNSDRRMVVYPYNARPYRPVRSCSFQRE